MSQQAPRVIATRISKEKIDTIEVLCLVFGDQKKYRLFTTTDEDLTEVTWDLDPVEFDRTDSADLERYLVESFWLLRICRSEIARACELFRAGITRSSGGKATTDTIEVLGGLGVLLVEMLNRIQTIDVADETTSVVLHYFEENLDLLNELRTSSTNVHGALHGCRLVFRELASELVLKNTRRNPKGTL